jgi:RNA polymerase sigma-70 factor (ECF subfamily)
LTTVARNRAIDRLRRSGTEAAKYQEVLAMPGSPAGDDGPVGRERDDSGIAVALTLRTLAGLTTAEIGRAFLVSEETMAKRLVRAKAKIRHAGIPYRVPPGHLLPERTVGVLAVLYLLFNEGYSATSGPELVRSDLCAEALRLAFLLTELMPDEPEARGLLALMLFHQARRPARTGPEGQLVPLEEQDRARWDRGCIEGGEQALEAALRLRRPGPYQVQAAIAACHMAAPRAEDTDWAEIALLYERLAALTSSPVVELNRAVAVAMDRGPAAGLELVDRLEAGGRLAGYHLLPATRADFLRRLSRWAEAADAYARALAMAGSEAERSYLRRRLDEVTAAEVTAAGARGAKRA